MKSLLLTILLLGLVAVLKSQEAPSDDQEDVRMGGTWVLVGDGLALVGVGPMLSLVSLKTEV